MSGEMMTFPKTWEEYEKYWGFNDSDEVYTNNARLIPSFRVKQWLDHIKEAEPKNGKWECSNDPWKAVCSFSPCKTAICSVCKLDTFDRIDYAEKHYKFCPYCGTEMEVTE